MCYSIKIMKHLQHVKKICYFNIIPLFFIIIYISNRSDDNLVLFPISLSLISFPINTSFREELINERLTSYFKLYNNSTNGCNATGVPSEELAEIFSSMSQSLITLRQQIVTYPNEYFHGRGIVLTVGPHQLDLAKVNLKMIQYSGTRLPVQIWYSSTQIPHRTMNKLLKNTRKLNSSVCCFHTAECRTLKQKWKLNTTHVYKPHTGHLLIPFPYKPAAIISSTFAEVLFLDSDAFVTRDPQGLFLTDPMYLKFGALFFPDAHTSRQHSAAWKVFNTNCGEVEYEFDSSAILVDKKRVWNGLYMTKLMNDNHQLFYRAITDGDKDTFRFGFRYMNVIKYYLVMVPCATGRFNGTHFCGLTLCKTDSLAQHIYINHVHIFKHERIVYEPVNLEYSRIALGDPNNNSFYFDHCRWSKARTSCFHITTQTNSHMKDDGCYAGVISKDEIDHHEYKLNESLLFERSRNNRILLSKTNNLMPHFVTNLLKHLE